MRSQVAADAKGGGQSSSRSMVAFDLLLVRLVPGSTLGSRALGDLCPSAWMSCKKMRRHAASAESWQNATTTRQAPSPKNAKCQSDSWPHADGTFYGLPSREFHYPK
jgi:hypothetical protein